MFLGGQSGATRHGQWARGPFLMVFCHGKDRELRALVRSVKMKQSGHFMVALASVFVNGVTHEIWLSGTYGHDGLPIDTLEDKYDRVTGQWSVVERWPGLWDRLHPLPLALQECFWKGGGHNSAGSEGPEMVKWANRHLKELRRLGDNSSEDDT